MLKYLTQTKKIYSIKLIDIIYNNIDNVKFIFFLLILYYYDKYTLY